jgi:hypothetical protein
LKIAYGFSTSGHTVSYKLGKMILPQLEQGEHGADVVGMFFPDLYGALASNPPDQVITL